MKESMLTSRHGSRQSSSMSGVDLIDLLEGGDARECLSDDVVGTPLGRDGERWLHAVVEVDSSKTMFRLFLETVSDLSGRASVRCLFDVPFTPFCVRFCLTRDENSC